MKYAIRKENQYYQILKDLNLGMTKENKAIYYDLNQIQRVINNMNPVNAQKYDIVAENPTLDQRLNVLKTGSLNSKWYRVMKIMCHDGSNIAEQEKDYKKQLSFYDEKLQIYYMLWKITIRSLNFSKYHGRSERIGSIEEFVKTILCLFSHLKRV